MLSTSYPKTDAIGGLLECNKKSGTRIIFFGVKSVFEPVAALVVGAARSILETAQNERADAFNTGMLRFNKDIFAKSQS